MRLRTKLLAAAAGIVGLGAMAAWQAGAAETTDIGEVSHIHGIAVDRTDPSRLYLATHYGVYRTNPDGTATRLSENRNDYMGFTPHPTEAGTFYASGHPSGGGNLGVIKSIDAAQTWEQISQGASGPVDFHAMDISAADPNVIYGLYGNVQVSRDAGRSWEETGRPPADVFDLAASAKDPNTVYAATRAGLMVSKDAGRTWQPAYLVQRPASMVTTTPDGIVYAFQVGTGLLKATEPSLDWQPIGSGFGDAVVLHLAAAPTDPDRLYAVTSDGRILASEDAGKTWAPLAS